MSILANESTQSFVARHRVLIIVTLFLVPFVYTVNQRFLLETSYYPNGIVDAIIPFLGTVVVLLIMLRKTILIWLAVVLGIYWGGVEVLFLSDMLCIAVQNKASVSTTEGLIKFGAIPTVDCSSCQSYHSIQTLLGEAVAGRQFEVVNLLLARGADPNGLNTLKRTPMFALSESCKDSGAQPNERIIEALVKAGADINARDSYQQTPLLVLAEDGEGCTQLTTALLAAGARMDITDNLLKTSALEYALLNKKDSTRAIATVLMDKSALQQLAPEDRKLMLTSVARKCDDVALGVLLAHGVSFSPDMAKAAASEGCEATLEKYYKSSLTNDELMARSYTQPTVFILDSNFGIQFGSFKHGDIVRALIERHYRNTKAIALGEGLRDISGDNILSALETVLEHSHKFPKSRIVVNLSWGSVNPDPLVTAVVQKLQKEGAIIVAAVGNDGSPNCMYPAGLPGVIAVASVVREGESFQLADYSNYGSCVGAAVVDDPTRLKADLQARFFAAKGRPAFPHSGEVDKLEETSRTAGTSFAAPVVAGAIAEYILRNGGTVTRENLSTLAQRSSVPHLGIVPIFR